MKRGLIALGVALAASAALAAGPRLTFMRTVAPAHDLTPAQHVAVIYAIGDSDKITLFLEDFLDRTNRMGALRAESILDLGHHFIGSGPLDAKTISTLRREHPADAYLGINQFTCNTSERGGEGSEHGVDGERIRRNHVWIDATCRTRIDVMNGEGKRLFSFMVHGEGTSPRVEKAGIEERNIALEQAAHFAAVSAAEAVTPRTVRETIELDETAPSFDEAYSMIVSERFVDARAIWEAALRRHRDSAALHFDLGAVCEALGDTKSAQRYYEEAKRLAPQDHRINSELMAFKRRTGAK